MALRIWILYRHMRWLFALLHILFFYLNNRSTYNRYFYLFVCNNIPHLSLWLLIFQRTPTVSYPLTHGKPIFKRPCRHLNRGKYAIIHNLFSVPLLSYKIVTLRIHQLLSTQALKCVFVTTTHLSFIICPTVSPSLTLYPIQILINIYLKSRPEVWGEY